MDFDKVHDTILYERPDPTSEEAFYEKELPDDHVEIVCSYKKGKFVWDRKKSNENVDNHSFSHYLSAVMYVEDEYAFYNGDTIDGKQVFIKTDDDNLGVLLFCRYLNLQKEKDALVLVRQTREEYDRIRLVTCYPTKNDFYIETYWKNRKYLEDLRPGKPEFENDIKPEDFGSLKERRYRRSIESLVAESLRAYDLFERKVLRRSLHW